ncbi:MAG: hypothetical protein WC624_00940 [Candidatus Margulisiibacteriota bacterium]
MPGNSIVIVKKMLGRFSSEYQTRRDEVKSELFKNGFISAGLTVGRFARLSFESPARFICWMEVLRIVGEPSHRKIRLITPWYSRLGGIAVEKFPTRELASHLSADIRNVGKLRELDLGDLKRLEREFKYRYSIHNQPPVSPDKVKQLLEVIFEERTIYARLGADPKVKDPTKVLRSLGWAIEKGRLPFLNIRIYLRDQNDRWSIYYHNEKLSFRDGGKYLGVRDVPNRTLKSIARSSKTLFDVDLANLDTFEKEGIESEAGEDINADLNVSRGPTRALFIKINGLDAVVQIMNRIDSSSRQHIPELLPQSQQDAELIKGELLTLYFREVNDAIDKIQSRARISPPLVPQATALEESIVLLGSGYKHERATRAANADVLTSDLLFRPELELPNSQIEYLEQIKKLVDENGVFEGDQRGVEMGGLYFPDRMPGMEHHRLKRFGDIFDVEIFSPAVHGREIRNRIVFDTDLVVQRASYDAYMLPGVSYDRKQYYEDRILNSDRVVIIRRGGWPVSFASFSEYEMFYNGAPLSYAFIHFVMTIGQFQGWGLTTYSIKELLSSAYWKNAWRNEGKNLSFDPETEKIENRRFEMWVCAHSGRATVFNTFKRAFQMVNVSDRISQAIVLDAHGKITPTEEINTRELDLNSFLDRGVYPPNTRYPQDSKGNVVIPASERQLATFPQWLELIGGEQGLKDGNAIYLTGKLSYNDIRRSRKKEADKFSGGSAVEKFGDWIRGVIVRGKQ